MATKSEDVLGEKVDHCLADTAIKMGSGLLIGSALSLVLFKRRKWPLIFGLGTGLGMGMSNCEHSLNEPHLMRIQEMKAKKGKEENKSEKKEEKHAPSSS